MKNQNQLAYFGYLKKLINVNLKDDSTKSEPLIQLLQQLESLPPEQQENLILQFLTLYIESDVNKELGFNMAKNIPITAYGKVGMASRMAPTILESIRITAKYHHTVAPLVIYSLSVYEDYTDFEIGFNHPVPPKVEATLVSGAILSLFNELKVLGATKDTAIEIVLNDRSAEYASLYKKHVGFNPNISGENNYVRLNTQKIRAINPLSDIETFNKLVEEIDDESKTKSEETIRSKLTRIVKSHLSETPSLLEVAKGLNMSERQLRFALTKENISYQEIVKQCKLEFATRMLNDTQIPISVIANRLGYKDLAAFNHSFKRWTGHSPSSYRKNNSSS